MMLQPGLEAQDCPNFEVCDSATELTPEEEVELIRIRQIESQERERLEERFRVNRRQAAVMMLMARGCPQTPQSLGINSAIAAIQETIEELQAVLAQCEEHYIAPPEVEAHQYNVKRPSAVYWYNKLLASSPIFEPSEKTAKVRVIHLSHDDDPRNLEGRIGIQRRNRLLQAKRQLEIAAGALSRALEQALDCLEH